MQPNFSSALQNFGYTPQTPSANQTPSATPTDASVPAQDQSQSSQYAIPNGLDPRAVNMARAIREQESGGNYTIFGDSNTSKGAYQWSNYDQNGHRSPMQDESIPSEFQDDAKKYGLDSNDFSPKNQDMVAYHAMLDDINAGLAPKEIAAKWNGSDPNRWQPNYVTKSGVPAQGVSTTGGAYDVPAYANAVYNNYLKYKQLSGTNNDTVPDVTQTNTDATANAPINAQDASELAYLQKQKQQSDENYATEQGTNVSKYGGFWGGGLNLVTDIAKGGLNSILQFGGGLSTLANRFTGNNLTNNPAYIANSATNKYILGNEGPLSNEGIAQNIGGIGASIPLFLSGEGALADGTVAALKYAPELSGVIQSSKYAKPIMNFLHSAITGTGLSAIQQGGNLSPTDVALNVGGAALGGVANRFFGNNAFRDELEAAVNSGDKEAIQTALDNHARAGFDAGGVNPADQERQLQTTTDTYHNLIEDNVIPNLSPNKQEALEEAMKFDPQKGEIDPLRVISESGIPGINGNYLDMTPIKNAINSRYSNIEQRMNGLSDAIGGAKNLSVNQIQEQDLINKALSELDNTPNVQSNDKPAIREKIIQTVKNQNIEGANGGGGFDLLDTARRERNKDWTSDVPGQQQRIAQRVIGNAASKMVDDVAQNTVDPTEKALLASHIQARQLWATQQKANAIMNIIGNKKIKTNLAGGFWGTMAGVLTAGGHFHPAMYLLGKAFTNTAIGVVAKRNLLDSLTSIAQVIGKSSVDDALSKIDDTLEMAAKAHAEAYVDYNNQLAKQAGEKIMSNTERMGIIRKIADQTSQGWNTLNKSEQATIVQSLWDKTEQEHPEYDPVIPNEQLPTIKYGNKPKPKIKGPTITPDTSLPTPDVNPEYEPYIDPDKAPPINY